jgi:hypothetical protein
VPDLPPGVSETIMRRNSKESVKVTDDMRPEYRFDYSQSRANRFAKSFSKGKVAVVLEPDVASVFNTSEAVNRVLRSLIAALPERAQSGRVARRKKAG